VSSAIRRSRRAWVDYQVLQYTRRNFEIFWLDGLRVARVLLPCGHCANDENLIQNIPISEEELALENQRVDSEVATFRELRAQGKGAGPPDTPPQILVSRILELCTFSNPRREAVKGRSTILLDFACDPSATAQTGDEALLKSFSGTVGIDEAENAVQRVEGKFLADVRLNEGKIEIHQGTRVMLTNVRVDTGIWLLSTLRLWGEARYFGFALEGEATVFAGNYRKFRITSRILAPDESPTPVTSTPSTETPPPEGTPLRRRTQVHDDQWLAQETQVRGYWVDPATGLMWAGKDNGKDINWHKATKYCRDLRLAGYSDWRLPTIDELQGISDNSVPASWLAVAGGWRYILYGHAKGGLSLTGSSLWSSSRENDDRGKPSGYALQFDFPHAKRDHDQLGYSGSKRALCTRGSVE